MVFIAYLCGLIPEFSTIMVHVRKALLSTFYKDGLAPLVNTLSELGCELISTGGTLDFIKGLGLEVQAVEDLTGFPEMLGGRVKTLHPKVFGGILNRRDHSGDQQQILEHSIPSIDLVVVNLYPFEETVAQGRSHEEIIEKIDIGGVSLIRAAAKNSADVAIVADPSDYQIVSEELKAQSGFLSENTRKRLAAKAFRITAAYDAAIAAYLDQELQNKELPETWVGAFGPGKVLRYGENPHQKAAFYGQLNQVFDVLHGKELSYNNLVDAESALDLLKDLPDNPAAVIVKHTNACGVALGSDLAQAYSKALACDPVSAFGGVIALNRKVDVATALLLNELFFEILMAPGFDQEAMEVLTSKKNRILLKIKETGSEKWKVKSLFNGLLVQEADTALAKVTDFRTVTDKQPTPSDLDNAMFANTIVKHTKSNTIVLTKAGCLLASGTGQTSRVDALRQAIAKARNFGFDLQGAAMASDAFFPFSDCVEIAAEEGIRMVIQPGGSIRDNDTVNACNRLGIAMVITGIRHFKH